MPDITLLLGRTLVLVAHPDDETVGCAALLQRIREPIVVFCTDAAPSDEFFWRNYGSRLRYARVRQEEAERVLGIIGVTEIEFVGSRPFSSGEGIRDQQLHEHLQDVFGPIADLVSRHRPEAILTLAYEGGHPDHDACSLLAATAGRQHGLSVWEYPLYHRLSTGEMQYQRFVVPNERDEVLLEITPEELENKQAMLNAYTSQLPFLSEFDAKIERFRPQRAYDYSHPPHAGQLNFEAWQWSMTGATICAAFDRFLKSQAAVKQ